jgi:tetratricopeptide (TPR) repeat protein
LQQDYPAALAAYRQVIELDRSLDPESEDVASDLSDLADAERMSRDRAAAERDYREALRIAQKLDDRSGVATYTGNLAALALDRQDWPAAKKLARAALRRAEKIGRQELIVRTASTLPKRWRGWASRRTGCPTPAARSRSTPSSARRV